METLSSTDAWTSILWLHQDILTPHPSSNRKVNVVRVFVLEINMDAAS